VDERMMVTATDQDHVILDRIELVNELETLLQGRLGSRVFDLHLDVRAGGLVLVGHTHSYYAKQLAQQALLTITCLPLEANEIEVD
jgi:hypothetical protein